MKGNEKIIASLNSLLADELTAVNQYIVHGEMNANWGYVRLHEYIQKRAIDEMKHGETLIERILYLEGIPVVSDLNKIHIGEVVEKQFANDHEAELVAIAAYNKAIKAAYDLEDHGTEEILRGILKDEEDHLDWIEAQQDQIKQMGVQNYLAMQVVEED